MAGRTLGEMAKMAGERCPSSHSTCMTMAADAAPPAPLALGDLAP